MLTTQPSRGIFCVPCENKKRKALPAVWSVQEKMSKLIAHVEIIDVCLLSSLPFAFPVRFSLRPFFFRTCDTQIGCYDS